MFTRDQIDEIRRKLELAGVRDSSFPEAGPLHGDEVMAILQDGANKSLAIRTLVEKVGIHTMSDFLNISKAGEESYSLEEALAMVDPVSRKAGQVITFMDRNTGNWSIYQFKGVSASEWFDTDKWDDILAKVDNHFKGWFLNEELLKKFHLRPIAGDYAFVGDTLEDAVVYACIKYGEWYNTKHPAIAYANKFRAVYSEDFGEFETVSGETQADRAVKDSLGRVISDTYITGAGLSEAIADEVRRQLAEIVR